MAVLNNDIKEGKIQVISNIKKTREEEEEEVRELFRKKRENRQ
jgi:tRNA-binding EMAP/Myf-like protein